MAALPGAPAIMAISDCASFATTVQPYLSQLPDLSVALYKAATTSSQALLNLYSDTNPLLLAFLFSLFAGAIFFVVSEANRNYSQVDRMWSILPFVYVLHYNIWARRNGISTGRNDLAALVIGAWSTRLTFNYARKGGYSIGSEDYRWAIIHKYIGNLSMFILNLTFISFVQSVSYLPQRMIQKLI
jgi:steroid 5-alpha reductase family enzyme